MTYDSRTNDNEGVVCLAIELVGLSLPAADHRGAHWKVNVPTSSCDTAVIPLGALNLARGLFRVTHDNGQAQYSIRGRKSVTSVYLSIPSDSVEDETKTFSNGEESLHALLLKRLSVDFQYGLIAAACLTIHRDGVVSTRSLAIPIETRTVNIHVAAPLPQWSFCRRHNPYKCDVIRGNDPAKERKTLALSQKEQSTV